MSIQRLKQEIEEKEERRINSKKSQYQPKNCIASSLGECLKERYHSIVDYDKKPMADSWLQARFEEGNEQERRILIKLMLNGFDVTEGQKRFEIKDRSGRVILSGKIEGKIKFEEAFYPFEIKSMNPNIYDGINTVDDFAKYSHTKRYPKQIMAYMYNENCEDGFFILTDCLGHYKIITVKLDYAEMEKEMQNCELVMNCVEKKEAPEFTKNTALCRKCWACKTCCFPGLEFGEGVTILDDSELEIQLKRRQEIQEFASEYERLDKQVKEKLKQIPHAVCGNYESIAKTSTVNYKSQEAKTIQVTRVSIERIDSEIQSETA